MPEWDITTLHVIDAADDLHVAPFRPDGTTPGTPTWVWAVVVDGRLYVRAYHGTGSRWYGAALGQRAGQVHAAGAVHDVGFEPVPAKDDDQSAIDAAYRSKYASSPYLGHMTGSTAVGATVRIRPRSGGSQIAHS